MTTHTITIKFSGLTWETSRAGGIFASCTEGPAAAINLIKQQGRHNTQIAYARLEKALGQP